MKTTFGVNSTWHWMLKLWLLPRLGEACSSIQPQAWSQKGHWRTALLAQWFSWEQYYAILKGSPYISDSHWRGTRKSVWILVPHGSRHCCNTWPKGTVYPAESVTFGKGRAQSERTIGICIAFALVINKRRANWETGRGLSFAILKFWESRKVYFMKAASPPLLLSV